MLKNTATPKPKNSKILEKALENLSLCIKQSKCCSQVCLKDIQESLIYNCRYRFYTKSYEHRAEWFLEKVEESKIKNGKRIFYVDGGRKICGFCFRNLYKMNKNFYYKFLKSGMRGACAVGLRKGRNMTTTTNDAITWLQDYSFYRADRMPDNGDMMLPCGTRKLTIYEQYLSEKTEKLHYSVCRSSFYKIWDDRFENLKVKQVNSFSKCTTCVHIERELEKTRDLSKRTYLKKLMVVHNDRQMTERRYYYQKREKAKLNPSKFMSVIVDGMDQAKTNLPHFTGRLQKGMDPSSLLKTHIQGVINHGKQSFVTYIDINEYSHDANMVIDILLRTISDAVGKDGKLPEVLYIQADNCARENKNKFMLGFCELLVRLSVFKEVHLSFLYVGHTHEDIDAAFSRISEKLRTQDVETMPKLQMVIGGGIRLQGLYDVKSWIMPHLNDVKHHSKPLHFKFNRDGDKSICGWYRANSKRPWTRLDNSILNKVPTGKPSILLPPHFVKFDINGIKANIEKCRYILSGGEGQYKWWLGFLAELSEVMNSATKLQQYSKKGAFWLLPQLQNKAMLHKEEEIDISAAKHIIELMDKDLEDPVVSVSVKKVVKNKVQGKKKTKSDKGSK